MRQATTAFSSIILALLFTFSSNLRAEYPYEDVAYLEYEYAPMETPSIEFIDYVEEDYRQYEMPAADEYEWDDYEMPTDEYYVEPETDYLDYEEEAETAFPEPTASPTIEPTSYWNFACMADPVDMEPEPVPFVDANEDVNELISKLQDEFDTKEGKAAFEWLWPYLGNDEFYVREWATKLWISHITDLATLQDASCIVEFTSEDPEVIRRKEYILASKLRAIPKVAEKTIPELTILVSDFIKENIDCDEFHALGVKLESAFKEAKIPNFDDWDKALFNLLNNIGLKPLPFGRFDPVQKITFNGNPYFLDVHLAKTSWVLNVLSRGFANHSEFYHPDLTKLESLKAYYTEKAKKAYLRLPYYVRYFSERDPKFNLTAEYGFMGNLTATVCEHINLAFGLEADNSCGCDPIWLEEEIMKTVKSTLQEILDSKACEKLVRNP